MVEATSTNSVDPNKMVSSGSTLFVSILTITNKRHFWMQSLCWQFKELIMFCILTEVMAQDDTVTFEENNTSFSTFTYV